MKDETLETIYLYDGSWEGLLTAFYHACKAKDTYPRIHSHEGSSLFAHYVRVHSDEQIAEQVSAAVLQKISRNALYRAGLLYLSESDDLGCALYRYLLLGFSMGRKVDFFQSHASVRHAHEISRRVICESHRFLGLTRFESTNQNVLYAAIEPECNVLPLIAPHFSDRMGREQWIIHDVKRSIAALSKTDGRYEILPFSIEYQPHLSKDEDFFQALWRRYYRTVSIAQRKNLKLRNRFIPPRYFSHLCELNSDAAAFE